MTQVGGALFCGCTQLESAVLSSQITALSSANAGELFFCGFFEGCIALTSVQIPDSVTQLGMFTFLNCTSLTAITIPSSVTKIAEYAFYACTALTTVTIQTGLTQVGTMAFYLCDSLSDVYYTGTESDWSAISISTGNDALTSAALHTGTAILQVRSVSCSLSELSDAGYLVTLPITIENYPGFTMLSFGIELPDELSYVAADTDTSAICAATETNGYLLYILLGTTSITEEAVGFVSLYVDSDVSAGDTYILTPTLD